MDTFDLVVTQMALIKLVSHKTKAKVMNLGKGLIGTGDGTEIRGRASMYVNVKQNESNRKKFPQKSSFRKLRLRLRKNIHKAHS